MNIIIAGDGDVGFHLAQMLSNEKHNITVVDPHQALLRRIENVSDLKTIAGDSTSTSVLQEARVANCDLLISVLKDEKTNIITSILGKELGARKTLARINNPEYLNDENRNMFKHLGIDIMVCPERIASQEIVKLLKQPAATEFFEFSGGKLMLFLVKLDDSALVIGKSLDQIAAENPNLDFRCVAIHRESRTIIPRGRDKFNAGDLAYVITKPSGVEDILRLGGKKQTAIKNVAIVGAGRIGRKTAALLQDNYNVRLIDFNRERCAREAENLKKTLVIQADARNVEMLEEEGIWSMDAFLALTNDTETNIFTCLIARKFGVQRTIALVENIDFIDISQRIGVDTIINKKIFTASYIARFTLGPEVTASRCLVGVDAEALEFVARSGSKITRKAIRDMDVPEGSIIGGVIRGNDSFIAIGSTQIQENDKVVVFTLPHEISRLSKLFQ